MKRSQSIASTQLVSSQGIQGSKKSRSSAVAKKGYNRLSFYAPVVARTKTGVPQRLRINHRYCATLKRTSTGGALNTYVFSANGMYDPDITGTGHQPSYFDNMSALYDHYTVLSSRIKLRLVSSIADATGSSLQCAIMVTDGTGITVTNVENMIEQPRCVWTHLSALSNTYGPQNSLQIGFNAWRTFGSRALSDAELRGSPAANPTEQQYYTIGLCEATGTGTVAAIYEVVIEYQAEWTEPKQNASN